MFFKRKIEYYPTEVYLENGDELWSGDIVRCEDGIRWEVVMLSKRWVFSSEKKGTVIGLRLMSKDRMTRVKHPADIETSR